MSVPNNKKATSGKANTKDYLTQIKKETEGVKDQAQLENEDNEWNHHVSDDDEGQVSKGVVVEQGKVGTDKPKKLKDLFGDTTQKQPKPSKPAK